MIPFPGESVLIEDGVDITSGTDFSLYGDLVHRAGSRSLGAGDSWRLLAYAGDMDYLEETGTDCTVRWVVEVLSGTVTVTAAEGIDPTYGDYTMTLPTALGSHTVTGPATLKIDSTLTADQVLDDDGTVDAAFILGLVGTSGSAVVQQVKLEVWPAGGAHGAFVEQAAFDTDPVAALVRVTTDTETGQTGTAAVADTEASWDAAATAAVGDVTTGPYSFATVTPTGSGPHAQAGAQFAGSQSNDGVNVLTAVSVSPLVAMVEGVDWSTEFPLGPDAPYGEFIRPPTEVRDEAETYLYPQIGAGSVAWLDAGVVIAQTGQAAAVVPAITFAGASDNTPTITGPGVKVDVDIDIGGASLAAPTAGGTLTTTHTLPTDARYLFAHITHTGMLSAAPWPGTFPGSPLDPAVTTGINAVIHFGTGDPAGTFAPIKSFAHMPPYRVWMPEAVAAVISKVRQFHRDDGLGVTPPRAFGGASRIRTGRAYGYD